jgi:hypothetical protein
MKTSELFSLNWNDVLKGLYTAIGGAVVSTIMTSVNAGNFSPSWTAIWHGAIIGAVSYLSKNFFTPAKIVTPTE